MTRLSSILAAILLTFSGLAMADTAPIWKIVQPGDSPQAFAKRYDLTTAELIGLNPDLTRRPRRLIPGEPLNVNAQTDSSLRPAYRWVFTGGDPAGPSLVKPYQDGRQEQVLKQIANRLAKQIPLFTGVPEDIRERFRSQLEWGAPRIGYVRSTVDTPLVLHGLIFGGYRSDSVGGRLIKSKVKYWNGTVICLWHQPEQLAALYDPVSTPEGISYQLVAFLECQNAAVIRRELPPERVAVMPPPETTFVALPPLPEKPLPSPSIPEPSPPPTTREVSNRYYPYNQAGWLTLERVQIDPNGQLYDTRVQNNLYTGYERTFWFDRVRFFGVRGRIAGGYFDLDALAFDGNAGAVIAPNWGETLRFDLEGGVGYTTQQRMFYQPVLTPDLGFEWRKQKESIAGVWPYVRAQAVTNWMLLEGKHAFGDNYHNRKAELTLRPASLYGKLGFDEQFRGEVERVIDGVDVSFQADRIRMKEARLGFELGYDWTLYGSWDDWRYASPIYSFSRWGPGGGFEWLFLGGNRNWRLEGKLSRFTAHDDALWKVEHNGVQSLEHHWTEDQMWRGLIGIVYAPTTKWHGMKRR